MSVSSTSSGFSKATRDKSPDSAELIRRAPQKLLLVGADALAGRELLAPALENSATQIDTAESLLEALLVSGKAAGGAKYTVILAGVADEIEHLEDALRHLRHVNPTAKIVLLCEPPEEVICRQALHWGADDYFIVPLDAKSTRKIATGDCGHVPRAAGTPPARSAQDRPARPLQSGPRRASQVAAEPASLPQLPLKLQTELLEELLAGGLAGEGADFAAVALNRLARQLALEEKLHFEAAGPTLDSHTPRLEPRPGDIRLPVQAGDQVAFGTLILQPPHAPQAVQFAEEIAQWLAALLSLVQRFKQLHSLAVTDELSGAYNRRYFMSYMTKLIQIAEKNQSRITLLLFDIDDFKKYNDTFGHASGDAIIRELIKLLRACTREYDLVARIGGDEFAVVYRDNEPRRQPNSDHPKDVLAATERFREAIRNHHWPQTCNIKGEISISGGLATYPWHARSLSDLLAKADEALLHAKAAGKNVIVMHQVADPATPEPSPAPNHLASE